MDKIDSALVYGVAIIIFSIFSLQFDIMFQNWGESLGMIGMMISTASVIAKFSQ